jgi:hypothetical protein
MKKQLPPYLQMSETQIANELLLHGILCGSEYFQFEHCTTLHSIEHIRDLTDQQELSKEARCKFALLQHTTWSLTVGIKHAKKT